LPRFERIQQRRELPAGSDRLRHVGDLAVKSDQLRATALQITGERPWGELREHAIDDRQSGQGHDSCPAAGRHCRIGATLSHPRGPAFSVQCASDGVGRVILKR
jgi:hypothetical protein